VRAHGKGAVTLAHGSRQERANRALLLSLESMRGMTDLVEAMYAWQDLGAASYTIRVSAFTWPLLDDVRTQERSGLRAPSQPAPAPWVSRPPRSRRHASQ
jgi:hypothetical protein